MIETAVHEKNNAMRARAERYLADCSEYSSSYEREKLLRDWVKKGDMAANVVGDFEKRAGAIKGKRILEVGFGSGLYISAFGASGATMHGLEVNPVLLDIARENVKGDGIEADLRVYDGTTFPYPDTFFDYAYSISVLEHVSDAKRVLSEICRTLKLGGKLYLAFPNRWTPRETHTGVWFAGFLPRLAAQRVLRRFFGSNAVEELNLHFLSYTSLLRLLRDIPLSVQFEYAAPSAPRRFGKRLLGFFGLHHSAILSTVMLVLEKKV